MRLTKRFMKRISSILLVAYLCLSAVSCKKDPVPEEDFAWDIEMSAMYEQLGIVEEVRTGLASGDYLLEDSLLVYDGQGSLIARQGMQSDALGRKSMTVPNLTDGTYTFVLFQSCRLAGEPGLWASADDGELATLQICCPDVCVDGIQALGVAKERVTIRKGARGTVLTPWAAGNIVDFQVDNYTKKKVDWGPEKLPPIWLYVADHVAGFYPDSGRYLVLPDQKKAIGYLEEGQSHRKFFILTDSSEITASVQTDYGFLYYQDTIILSRGSDAVCYYSFDPQAFFNAYLGTPEGAEAFKADHAEDSCTLYPYNQWGSSRDEVDRYVKNRSSLPCGDGEAFVRQDGITLVRYTPAPGLAEFCVFDSGGKLIEVTYTYGGPVRLTYVQSCIEEQGFKYMGGFTQLNLIYRLYLSADGLTECVAYPTSDIIYAVGYENWAVTFIPFNPDDLNLLEF